MKAVAGSWFLNPSPLVMRVRFDWRHPRVKWFRKMRVICTEPLNPEEMGENAIPLLPVVRSASTGGTRIPRNGCSVNRLKHGDQLTNI
jgi:hypothetical protein